jgi:hypothetical protein
MFQQAEKDLPLAFLQNNRPTCPNGTPLSLFLLKASLTKIDKGYLFEIA